jgi:hypothetical protein
MMTPLFVAALTGLRSVGADLNLTHPADLNLTRGWVPAL